MIKWTLLVFALLGLQVSLATKAFRGPCPQNMTAIGDFNIMRFLGKWYTHSKYPSKPSKLAKCQSTVFKASSTGPFIESRQLNRKTNTVKFRIARISKVEAPNGRYYQETKNKAFPEGLQIYILDTDYENFAIRFMCFDSSSIFSYHWVSLDFRKRLPSPEVLDKAQKIAKKNGIVIRELVKVSQVACPRDT